MADKTNTIPKGWKMTTLGEVAEKIFSGGTPSTQRGDFYGGIIPWLRTQEVNFNYIYDTEIKITDEGLNSSSAKWVPANSVIIAMYGNSAGRVAFSKIPLTTNQACCNFVADKQKSDPAFIYFNLRGRYSEIEGMANGGAQQNLSGLILKELPLLLPQLPEQRAIAAVLSSLDDKIELLREQNKTLEATAQAIFKEWFVNFNFPNTGRRMSDSELGKIPEGWRVGILNDYIGELESGKRPKGGVGQLKLGVPSVGAESINGISSFEFSKTKYVSEVFYQKMNLGKVKDYDILIYKDGGTPGTFLPKFSMVGEGFPFSRFCINEHVFRMQTKKVEQRFYLYLWLNSFYCKRELQNIGGKAAIPGINSTDLRNISLLIPDETILELFHSTVSQSFKKILINNSQIQTLSTLRDTLLPKLMKGEVRIAGFND
ncbi:restriction endonuclease subunit S [Patescibacteria group bacterium]|nr:restriction endonuclease subunit S [Patescibacteria group bacterium]